MYLDIRYFLFICFSDKTQKKYTKAAGHVFVHVPLLL